MKKYKKHGFFILLLIVLPALSFTQDHDAEIWEVIRFSTMIDGGIDLRLKEPVKTDDEGNVLPSDEDLLIIRGGPTATISIIPLNLGFMNLGFSIGAVSITSRKTETESFHSLLVPANITIVKYIKRKDWDAFPYFALSPGVCAEALIAWNKTDGLTMIPPTVVPPPVNEDAAEDDAADNPPGDADNTTEQPVEKKLLWGGGGEVTLGVLTPLNNHLFLDLKANLKLYYTNNTFYKYAAGSIGLTLSF